jgi:hypothetical protein
MTKIDKIENLSNSRKGMSISKLEQLEKVEHLMAQYDTRKKTLSETVEELTWILKTMQEGAVAEESEEVCERRRKQEQAFMLLLQSITSSNSYLSK